MLNIIGCIDSADSGEVTIAGQFGDETQEKRAGGVSPGQSWICVFRVTTLFQLLTAFENVAFSLNLMNIDDKEVQERTMAILKEVGLEGMENRRARKTFRGSASRGLAIARAIVKDPEILLADEPTANLDSNTGQEILELMKTLNERHKSTFIFSTHDPMVMDFSSRLVRLHDGVIQHDERR